LVGQRLRRWQSFDKTEGVPPPPSIRPRGAALACKRFVGEAKRGTHHIAREIA
jgi:hypothetical protein